MRDFDSYLPTYKEQPLKRLPNDLMLNLDTPKYDD
jgi:hypothetical protein